MPRDYKFTSKDSALRQRRKVEKAKISKEKQNFFKLIEQDAPNRKCSNKITNCK